MPKQRPKILDEDVHEQLKRAVQDSPPSVTWLAKQLGRDRTTIYKWLDGTNAIPPTLLERFCSLLNLPNEQRIMQFIGRGYAVPRALLKPAHHLRAPIRDFVGRDEEISQVVAALGIAADSGTLAAISGVRGMGGIGKTELAMKAAHQLAEKFPDGQIMIELRGAGADPKPIEQALQMILRAIDPDTKPPDDLGELQARYCSCLRGKRMLILADDAHDAAQVRPLFPPPGCALLITSRQRFALPGMLNVDLGVLPVQEAIRLLHAICPRIAHAAPKLARLCGYLPLALRISASLLASNDTYRVARYLTQLEAERMKYLRDPDAPDDPQGSVEASLALSYDALDPDTQDALCQLSIFPIDFDLAATIAVLAPTAGDAETLLGRLRRRSLIEWEAGRARCRLHDLVREFARSRLRDPLPARQRHAEHFLQQAEQTSISADSSPSRDWFEHVDQEHEHFRAALRWFFQAAPADHALRLSVALGPFWLGREHIREGSKWVEAALTHAPIAQEPVHVHLQARALSLLGELNRLQGQFQAAHDLYERSGRLFLYELEEEAPYADVLYNLGMVAADQIDHRTAQAYFAQSLEMFQQQNRPRRVAAALASLGRAATLLGDTAAAEQFYAESAAMLRTTDDREQLAWLLIHLAWFRSDYGDRETALRDVDESLRHFGELGNRTGMAWATYRKGTILADQEHYAEARAILNQCLTYFEQLTTTHGSAMCHNKLTSIALAQDDMPAAWIHSARTLDYYQALQHQTGLGIGIEHVAMLVANQDAALAATLFGCAEAQIADSRAHFAPIDRPYYEQAIATAHAQLGEPTFAAMWKEGRSITLEQATILAQEACTRSRPHVLVNTTDV